MGALISSGTEPKVNRKELKQIVRVYSEVPIEQQLDNIEQIHKIPKNATLKEREILVGTATEAIEFVWTWWEIEL